MTVWSELKALVRLALPVSLAQLAIVGMSATDVLVAGWAGTEELAGMNLGVNTWNMIALFFMGIGFATQPLVARRFGAGQSQGVKQQLHQSTWLGLLCGIGCLVAVLAAVFALDLVAFDPTILRIAKDYLLVMSLGAIPFALLPALRGTLEGVSLTAPVMWVNAVAFLINIPLDIILVNGLYGAPKLGGVGCAWATVIVIYWMLLANFWMLKVHPKLAEQCLLREWHRPDWAAIGKTWQLGFPIGISIVVELSMFSGAGIMIAKFGAVETAAHAVAITVASASFMLYVGLGQGVTIRASQMLGAHQPDQAWYAVKVGTWFNVALACLFAGIYVVFAPQLVALASSDQAVVQLGVALLLFGAAFQLADCLQVAIICALRAYGDTVSPPQYQVMSFWVFGVPLGVGLAFWGWWPGLEGAKGMWFAMTASLYLVAILLFRRLLSMVKHYQHDYSAVSS